MTPVRALHLFTAAIVAGFVASALPLRAQQGGQQGAPAAAQTAQAAAAQRFAPADLTGTWVSVVTEDWALRMITPSKDNLAGLPLTRRAQDAVAQADMARVDAAGRACDAYGAPALLRMPGRVRISWQDAGRTLRLDTDAGQQTRLLHFDAAAARPAAADRQGFSRAAWQYANGFDPVRADEALAARAGGPPAGGRAGGGRAGGAPPRGRGAIATAPQGGRLKVETDGFTAGFLRKNGAPYSANATLTEYFNMLTQPDGVRWLIVTTVLHDPENLMVDYITSTNFRREADDSKFTPQPCSLR